MPLLLTLHWPLLPVVQEAVPVAPLLQLPVTVALASGLWLASCTVIVTLAVHLVPCLVLAPSRSPICIVVVTPGPDVGARVGAGPDVGVGADPLPTQLEVPESVKVCPAIGMNCQS